MKGSAMLSIENISKNFGGIRALSGITCTFGQKEIVSLIGPNGAGKTTLFNVICGFLAANDGSVDFMGKKLNGLAAHRIARLGLGRTFQDLRLIRKMTVMENVLLAFQRQAGEEVFGALAGWKTHRQEKQNRRRALELLEFVGLADITSNLGDELSYGQQKLLTIACCLALDAGLLLLDEPVAGIAPEMVEKMLGLLLRLREEGKTICLIEHNLAAVKAVSDRVIVLDEGRKIAEGKPEAVMQDAGVLEAYLT
jgi:ABC-type branched-subunit amino acid transport system ATPase component